MGANLFMPSKTHLERKRVKKSKILACVATCLIFAIPCMADNAKSLSEALGDELQKSEKIANELRALEEVSGTNLSHQEAEPGKSEILNTDSANEPGLLSKYAMQIKNVQLPGDNYHSFAFDMKMTPAPVQLFIQIRYRAPNDYAMNVFDGADMTPLLIVRDQKAIINDPLQEKVSLIASAGVAFDLSQQGEQFNANFAVNLPGEGQVSNRISMDFNALFAKVTRELKEKSDAPGTLELSGKTTRKNSCHAIFRPADDFPLQQLQISVENATEPILVFSNIAANGKIPADVFSFPLQQMKEAGVDFIEVPANSMFDSMMIVSSVMKALFTRAALRSPDLRHEIETNFKLKPDWSAIEHLDGNRTPKLQRVFRPY